MSAPPPLKTLQPSLIATLATNKAIDDVKTLFFSLAAFNPQPPTVYLYCDTELAAKVAEFKYPGKVVVEVALDKYVGLDRHTMERRRGAVYDSLWFDFMAEKIALMEWVFAAEATATGILFCDADICFFGPLPQIPCSAVVGLSHHMIRPFDEAKYGRYNGGFLWMRDREYLDTWRTACKGSRFYEQSALEDVATAVRNSAGGPAALYEFPKSQNYGWWRLWQSEAGEEEAKREWTMNRHKAPNSSGIFVKGEPLGSVHTHFFDKKDRATVLFNHWVIQWLMRLSGSHPPARRLLKWLSATAESLVSQN
jgi:hypothetical protein